MSTGFNDNLDPVLRLLACRKYPEAESLARGRLDALKKEPGPAALPVARAARLAAEVLLEQGRGEEAAELVGEMRRRYRPFASQPGVFAEGQLTYAIWAFLTDQSLEAETALGAVLSATREDPAARRTYARALRFEAHMEILRFEVDRGVELLEAALKQTTSPDAESALLRWQYLFSLAEVRVMRDEPGLARELVALAEELMAMRFAGDRELQKHGRERAEMTRQAADEAEKAPGLGVDEAELLEAMRKTRGEP
ncbi:MAG: hypothetical protein R3B70_28005 [Polyangiaceae bacterium]